MTGINIPSYTTGSGVVLSDAFAYNAGVYLDVSTGSGRIVLDVHPSEADVGRGLPPVEQISLAFGQAVGGFVAPTFAALLGTAVAGVAVGATPTVQDAYNLLESAFLAIWTHHPALAGATVVTG